MTRRGEAWPRIALAALAAALVACSAVLGLDAPKLDPCAESACADASEAGADAALDAPADGDARADARPDGAIVGVRCGGGTFGETRCAGQTPVCCQTTDGGVTSFACGATTGACAGYPIACASNADCSGNDVCCHWMSGLKCAAVTSCPNDQLACEPDGAVDQCPSGWRCTATLTNAGVASPYFGCAP